jgi:hypothetical protein
MSDRTLTQTKLASTLTFTPMNRGVLQRKCACGNHTVAGGECSGCAKNKSGLQRKLAIGASHDLLEREADHVADQVMTASTHSAVSGAPPRIQRYTGQATEGTETAPASVDRVLSSPGRPLDPALQQDMGQRFGYDFSRVRVHSGAAAEQSARDVNALAYTVGQNIVFGVGRFAPGTHEGRRLIAHELTHVVQQSSADRVRADQSNGERLLTAVHHNARFKVDPDLENKHDPGTAFDVAHSNRPFAPLQQLNPGLVLRQKLEPDESPQIERSFELDPELFIKRMDAPAVREVEKCEELHGGHTECEKDDKTGTPTGNVTSRIYETNPCTRPCAELHELAHINQYRSFCPKVRDCYRAVEQGKRSVTECFMMAISGTRERECEAYKVSVPCVENRLKNARECRSKENINYGTRKLASERCFRDEYCGHSASK